MLKALEAAQKEPKAPLSDMFNDGKFTAKEPRVLCNLCAACTNRNTGKVERSEECDVLQQLSGQECLL